MNIGKYAIIDNARYYLEKEPELYWEFRPATSMDELHMAKFYRSNTTRIQDPDGKWVNLPPYVYETIWEEIGLLFGSTNITDDDGNLILEPDASIEEVKSVLAKMPQELVEEIWAGLGEAVAGWGPRTPQPEEENGRKSSKSSKNTSETT